MSKNNIFEGKKLASSILLFSFKYISCIIVIDNLLLQLLAEAVRPRHGNVPSLKDKRHYHHHHKRHAEDVPRKSQPLHLEIQKLSEGYPESGSYSGVFLKDAKQKVQNSKKANKFSKDHQEQFSKHTAWGDRPALHTAPAPRE